MRASICLAASACVLALIGTSAPGQVAPLFVGNTNAILNEFDHILPGNGDAPGGVVQVLRADAGVFPPAVDGTPSTNNVVVGEGKVGEGIDPALGDAGLFANAAQGLDRSQFGDFKVFARAFNANSLTGSSFYGDSQIYTVPSFGSNYDVFVANIQKTSLPLDPGDADGDGLINSWEESLHGDPDNPDSDGDGIPDGPEFRSGTDITNSLSLLICAQIAPAGGPDVRVTWDSVTGKAYRVESTTQDLAANPLFTNVSMVITATTWLTDTVVTNGLVNPNAHYRVRLVESPEP